jgi:hypothetical protein
MFLVQQRLPAMTDEPAAGTRGGDTPAPLAIDGPLLQRRQEQLLEMLEKGNRLPDSSGGTAKRQESAPGLVRLRRHPAEITCSPMGRRLTAAMRGTTAAA